MKKLLTLISIIFLLQAKAQTIESIDSLREHVLKNLDQYESLQYFNKVISNEDAVGYDTACFYYDKKGELVYINWQERSHTFHISGDAIDIIELLFFDGKVVFYRNWGYSFKNPQWDKESNLSNTNISISESVRRYFSHDGTALMDYQSRETEGKYKDRFTLLDHVQLKEEEPLIWSDRCDDCIEEDYLSVFERLIEEK